VLQKIQFWWIVVVKERPFIKIHLFELYPRTFFFPSSLLGLPLFILGLLVERRAPKTKEEGKKKKWKNPRKKE